MGHTNSTVNYNLPQFVGTDKPSWLGDVNGAFLAIDTAIAAAKTEADSASGGVAGLQTTVGSHTTQIGTLTDTVTAQGGTLNSVTALIGNGTPTTTDQTIIGAINELNADMIWKKISSNTQYIQIPDGAVELFVIAKNSTSSSFKLVGNVLVQAILDYVVGGIPLWSISADFRIEYSSANGITATQYTNGTTYSAEAMVLYYR